MDQWLDLTLRVGSTSVEVDVQPDKSVEISFPLHGGSRATLLLPPDVAKALYNGLGDRLMLVPDGT